MSYILTIDLGTTYFKVCLFDDAGQLAAVRRVVPPTVRSDNGLCELPVDGFERVLVGAVRELKTEIAGGLSDVRAVCFATQANSFLLLDNNDHPLTPIILWPDERACPAEPVIRSLSQLDGFYHTTGIPEMSGQFMPAKLRWLRKHEPDVWREASRLCLISDYLTLWMTGQHVTEAGTAGLTGLVDVHQLNWWADACEHVDMPAGFLPHIVRAGTDLGMLRGDAAALFGLPDDCRFIVGCLDQYAGAIGAGNVTPGGVSETTGTVLATIRCADRFNTDASSGIFQGPGHDKDVWYQMVFGDTSANLLEAYRNSLPGRPGYEALCDMAAEVRAGSDGLRVNPGNLSGTNTMFAGLTENHTAGHRVRAILEAVAFALNEQVDMLGGRDRPGFIRSVGGAARSDLWLQIKADVLGLTFQATECAEPTSLGAAILAASSLRDVSVSGLVNDWVRIRRECPAAEDKHRQYTKSTL